MAVSGAKTTSINDQLEGVSGQKARETGLGCLQVATDGRSRTVHRTSRGSWPRFDLSLRERRWQYGMPYARTSHAIEPRSARQGALLRLHAEGA